MLTLRYFRAIVLSNLRDRILILTLQYPHVPHSVYNVVVVVVLIVAYASLLIHLSIQAAKSESTLRMSKLQRQTFIQCTVICTGTFIAALVYVI